ncbi:MAG: cytochrome C [Alphaproteobacteria bacterium]|uniref:Cytochrome C n=1 Tax=Candidatus Nitrobium versatile TaxID=2884831 RepID=A0A953J7F7_9BACT|nr:cytochrome C [Candidatus Nitrobium versatile]
MHWLFSTALAIGLCASGVWAEEVTYRTHIKPVFDAKCAGCHGKDAAPEYYAFKEEKEKWLSKGQGMRMDTYSHLVYYTAWPDTGALMRRLNDGKGTKDGKPGNMYQHLGATEEERQKNLALFKAWVGNWTLVKWPEITKEDMNGIKVKY